MTTFGGFITNVLIATKARANLIINGETIDVLKTTLIINPKINVKAGRNIFSVIMTQSKKMVTQTLISASKTVLNVIMHQRIKPKNAVIIIKSERIVANTLVKQYNHIYNVSGSTITNWSGVTIDQASYTVI